VAWSRDGDRLLARDIAEPAAEICVEARSDSNTAYLFDIAIALDAKPTNQLARRSGSTFGTKRESLDKGLNL